MEALIVIGLLVVFVGILYFRGRGSKNEQIDPSVGPGEPQNDQVNPVEQERTARFPRKQQ